MPFFVSYILKGGKNDALVQEIYDADPSTFRRAKITVKVQKKHLIFFWKTVKIDNNDSWVTYSYNSSDSVSKSFPVSGSGTYRATFKVEVTDTSGHTESVEQQKEVQH